MLGAIRTWMGGRAVRTAQLVESMRMPNNALQPTQAAGLIASGGYPSRPARARAFGLSRGRRGE